MSAAVKERVADVPAGLLCVRTFPLFPFSLEDFSCTAVASSGAQFAHAALVNVGKAGRGVSVLASFSSVEMIDVHGSCKVDIVD